MLIEATKQFRKEFRKIQNQGKDLTKIKFVINTLAAGGVLPIKYKDHKLIGTDARECHIEPDWLLVYKIVKNKTILLLLRTGSHSELNL